MKTKFQPIIYTKGELIAEIVNIIASNNSGNKQIGLHDIESYIKCKQMLYPSMFRSLKMEIVMNELVIMENGEDVSMIIVEQEIHELKIEEEVNS
jgi:hypothetical protein